VTGTRLIRKLADLVPVALCSGNHDNAGRPVSHDRATVYGWFIDLGTNPNIIADGSTRKLENSIVTTVPCNDCHADHLSAAHRVQCHLDSNGKCKSKEQPYAIG
jgi:hypothetical protein